MKRLGWSVLAFGCALALGCDGVEGDPAPLCRVDSDCPAGSRCVGGAMCEAPPDAAAPRERPRFDLAVPPITPPSRPPPTRPRDGGVPIRDAGPRADAGLPGSERCLPQQAFCRGECVDVLSDDDNCGACGVACPMGQRCNAGVCCDASRTVCGDRCVDTFSDREHCGVCDFSCDAGSSCVIGVCTPDDLPVL